MSNHLSILNIIRNNIKDIVRCDLIKPLSGNYETKSMYIYTKDDTSLLNPLHLIIVGSDNTGKTTIDITSGGPTFAVQKDDDLDAINTTISWIKRKYM